MTRSTTLIALLFALGSAASCTSEKPLPAINQGGNTAKKPANPQPALKQSTSNTSKPDTSTTGNGETPAIVKTTPAAKGPALSAEDKRNAKIQWIVCATCHGNTGKGDGLAGLALNPKPRTFVDAEWQASTTDERLFKVIKEGGGSVGLSPLMVGYPHLTDGTIYALISKIRGFVKK